MKRSLLLLIFLSSIFAGCTKDDHPTPEVVYEGDVHLYSQEEVEAFAAEGYTRINGTLGFGMMLGENNITSLKGLKTITKVKDLIVQNTKLTSLEGLHNITSSNNFLISKNHYLVEIDEMQLKSIEHLSIGRNDRLESISGFSNLQGEITNLKILRNPSLTNLDGLEGLTSVVNDVLISKNDDLQDLHGLIALEKALAVQVSNNPGLHDLGGLSDLESVKWLNIRNNEALVSLSGLESLSKVSGYLEIYGNTNLTDYCALQHLLDQDNGWWTDIRISENKNNPSKESLLAGECAF